MAIQNPGLYARLMELFQDVGIAHAGEPVAARIRRNPISGRMDLELVNSGENYKVRCPFCQDEAQRLYIHHNYGKVIQGYDFSRLVRCWRRECMREPANQLQLKTWLDAPSGYRSHRIPSELRGIGTEIAEDFGPVEVEPPGRIFTLDRLPPNHYARSYVEQVRGYDAVALSRDWGVGFVTDSPHHPTLANRLYFPVYTKGQLRGWQGRYPGELDWKAEGIPKFYNLPTSWKRHAIYGYDYACQWRAAIIVEGVWSVWTIGPPTISFLGKSMSAQQLDLVAETWPEGVIVLLDGRTSDEDTVHESADRMVTALRSRIRGPVIALRLPDKTQPTSYQAKEICPWIHESARRASIPLLLKSA